MIYDNDKAGKAMVFYYKINVVVIVQALSRALSYFIDEFHPCKFYVGLFSFTHI